jgi:hypothetical protein
VPAAFENSNDATRLQNFDVTVFPSKVLPEQTGNIAATIVSGGLRERIYLGKKWLEPFAISCCV